MTQRNRKIFRARARPFGPLTDGPDLLLLWLRRQWLALVRANQDRMILALPILFGCGIALWFGVPQQLPFDPFLLVGLMSLAGALWWGRISTARHAGAGFAASLALAALVAGYLATDMRTRLVAAPMIGQETVTLTIEGRTRAVQPRADGSQRLLIDEVLLPQGRYRGLPDEGAPARLRISLRGDQPAMHVGDRVSLRGVLRPPAGPVAPQAHDFGRDAFYDRIGGTGFAYGKAQLVQAWDGQAGWATRLDIGLQRMRFAAANAIYHSFSNKVAGGIAAALLTGERGFIPPDTSEALRGAGLAHLLAISGLHMGLAAGMLFVSIRLLLILVPFTRNRIAVKKWAAGSALVGAFGYLLLSGASVSAERAFIMVACGFAAIMIDRVALSMRLVAFAAMVILIWRPENLLNAGFQMSFAAVAALIAVYEEIRDRPDSILNRAGQHQITAYVVGLISTSLIAGLATAPFAAWHFGRVADYGLLANLLAMPVMALWVMPLGAVALLLLPFGLADGPLMLMGTGIEWIVGVAHWVTGLAGAEFGIPAVPVAVLALLAAGLVWLCAWRGSLRWAGLAALAVGLSLWANASALRPDIVISDDGGLIAVQDALGVRHYSSMRKARYDRAQWQKRDGDLTGANAVAARCDGLGCRYPVSANGIQVASVSNMGGLAEECARLSQSAAEAIIVAQFYAHPKLCPGVSLIDEYRIKKEGPIAIRQGPSGLIIETAAAQRGDKPWNQQWPQ